MMSHLLSSPKRVFLDIQTVIIMNFVVVSNVSKKRVDCSSSSCWHQNFDHTANALILGHHKYKIVTGRQQSVIFRPKWRSTFDALYHKVVNNEHRNVINHYITVGNTELWLQITDTRSYVMGIKTSFIYSWSLYVPQWLTSKSRDRADLCLLV